MQTTQWEQYGKIAHYWACRYLWAAEKRNDIDLEDLQQAAFLGVLRADKAYQEDKGSFFTLAGFYARNEIRALLGIKNGKLPPTLESLDEPLNDDTEDTRLDLLADETIPEADSALIEEEKRQTVRAAVDRLKEDQKTVVDLRFFQGMSYPQAAFTMKVTPDRVKTIWESARTNLHRDRSLWGLISRSTQYMRHVGIAQFNTTMTSAVEALVILREQLINKVQTGAKKDKRN